MAEGGRLPRRMPTRSIRARERAWSPKRPTRAERRVPLGGGTEGDGGPAVVGGRAFEDDRAAVADLPDRVDSQVVERREHRGLDGRRALGERLDGPAAAVRIVRAPRRRRFRPAQSLKGGRAHRLATNPGRGGEQGRGSQCDPSHRESRGRGVWGPRVGGYGAGSRPPGRLAALRESVKVDQAPRQDRTGLGPVGPRRCRLP